MANNEEFLQFYKEMNEKILAEGNQVTNNFFNLESHVFEAGALDVKTKEMLGLVSSLVLKCDDSITHHLLCCRQEGLGKKELFEVFNIALLAGGIAVLPHLREAVEILQKLEEKGGSTINTSETNNMRIDLYTDGACANNPGPGGYAALIIREGQEIKITGNEPQTTNNRMEMRAVIEALKNIKKGSQIRLFSDSSYVIQGMTNWVKKWKQKGWKTSSKKAVKNKDLWQQLDKLQQNYQMEFNKIKGHSGNKYNEKVDTLAKKEIDKIS